jgi:hypothetical protein
MARCCANFHTNYSICSNKRGVETCRGKSMKLSQFSQGKHTKMVLILVFSQNSSCRKTTLAFKNLKITTKVRAHLLFAEHPVLTERRLLLNVHFAHFGVAALWEGAAALRPEAAYLRWYAERDKRTRLWLRLNWSSLSAINAFQWDFILGWGLFLAKRKCDFKKAI